jgi:hypothetical protein
MNCVLRERDLLYIDHKDGSLRTVEMLRAREEVRDQQRARTALERLGEAVTGAPVMETAIDHSTSVGCSSLVLSVRGPKR